MPRTTKNKQPLIAKRKTIPPMTQENISENDRFNIVDILLLDHLYLKECIDILKDENEEKRIKFRYAKGFLDALKKHSDGEKKSIYAPLENTDEFRTQVLQSVVEHGIVDAKIRILTRELSGVRNLTDEMEAELKVLAELVKMHVKEEESNLLPKMREQIDSTLLNEMGFQFLTIRQFTEKDLEDNPELQEEVPFIKSASARSVGNLKLKTQEYFKEEAAQK